MDITIRPAPQPATQLSAPVPTVLVGIITRNRAAILSKAIQSAFSQDYGALSVSVLDDGSTDDTPALANQFPSVNWTRCEMARGVLESRNHLMRTANADYFLSLDDDAWFLAADEISLAVEHLQRHPNVAAVAFDILSPDAPDPRARASARPVNMFIGCGHVLRLSALREVGFYASSPGFYGGEEKDLCLRLLDKSWDIQLLPGVHVWHDKTTVARDLPAQHRSNVCNDLVFALRRCPFPMALWTVPLKVLSHIRFSMLHHLMRPCFSGIALFLRHALDIVANRQPVQSKTFREFLRRSRAT